MRYPSKKDRERYFLERAKSAYADFPIGELLSTETPDFLVKTDCEVLGIELTNFIRWQCGTGSELREIEMTHDRVVNSAQKKFERKWPVSLQVRFNWAPHPLSNRKEEQRITSEIVEVVNKFVSEEIYQPVILIEELGRFYLGKFINRISILRKNPTSKSLWANTEAGVIGISISELQSVISDKENKINLYLQKCSSIWLLIVADGEHISSSSDLGEDVGSYIFRSNFDKVLFYDSFQHRVVELNVEAK